YGLFILLSSSTSNKLSNIFLTDLYASPLVTFQESASEKFPALPNFIVQLIFAIHSISLVHSTHIGYKVEFSGEFHSLFENLSHSQSTNFITFSLVSYSACLMLDSQVLLHQVIAILVASHSDIIHFFI
ncbi:MAG: hypothetical protein Q4A00_07445, partial [Flavobacteriaceae bacterium]|nr:hypothetical protein [Flavobacteriaceae bacterium]